MKGILKNTTRMPNALARLEGPSHSVGVVRWTSSEETGQPHSSAPSYSHLKNPTSTRSQQQRQRQQSLKDIRSLQECVRFLHLWKVQVAKVCQKDDAGEGCSKWAGGISEEPEDPRTERCLEESRKLIMQWASELNSVDKLSKESPWMQKRFEHSDSEDQKTEDLNEIVQQRVMEWARELQIVSENAGMHGEELAKTLRLLGLKKKRLVTLMPLLEFITWSLLKEDNKDCMISHLWLSSKQRSWKAGIPQYIPNSVWSWITSAAADVTLDPKTSHPWLQISEDQKQCQEGLQEACVQESPQRFDSWPCVLGWEGYMSGRHYWEVDIANNGYWRVGVTSASAKRHGRFPMKPSKGYWTLWRSTRCFYACTNEETPLPLMEVPRKLGIYLDYEEGQISFYNAKNKSHIFTFTTHFREKVYPLFAPLDGRTLITVSSSKDISSSFIDLSL